MTKAMVWIAAIAAILFTVETAAAQSDDDPAQVDAGAEVFAANCSSCHGAEGEGSPAGRSLVGVGAENDRARHVESVTNGRGNMPAFANVLSAEEIESVVSFVRLTFVQDEEPAPEPEETADAEGELANTGVESAAGVIAALTLLGGGAMLVRSSRLQTRRG